MSIIQEKIVNSGHGALNPKGLVIHSTANVGATALNHVNYWKRSQYAVHYVCDWLNSYHCMKDNRKAYHVGNANNRFIGLEICEASTREQFNKGWKIAVQTAAEILQRHGWDTDQMFTHDYCRKKYGGTDHTDPYPYFKKWSVTWEQFVSDVDKALKGASVSAPKVNTKPPAKKTETKKTNTVKAHGSIADVQAWLNNTYATKLDVDGVYGKKTKAGLVKALQTELNKQFKRGLVRDGIFGAKTKAACVNVKEGAKGNITRILQGALICNGYGTNGFDGIFGAGTEAAVKAYQKKKGLSVDGVAGKNTFAKLLS